MSRTMAVGVVGPSHWAYMAKVMAEALNKAVQKSLLVKTDIPAGVLFDAAHLSRLILEEARFRQGGEVPSNPPATINAYVIAQKAVERVVGYYPKKTETELLLHGCRLITDFFADKFCSLGDETTLQGAAFMANFFSELCKMGEEEGGDRGLTWRR